MFNVSIFFLIIGYIAFLYVVKLQKHNHMLFANVLSCFFTAIYLMMNDAFAGATISLIACLASVIQIVLGSSKIVGSLKIRNISAITFAVIAVSMLYQKPSDLLPCIAFTQYRIFEAQGLVQFIRLAVFVGGLLWGFYAYTNQLYSMAIIEVLISAYALFCLVKFHEVIKPISVYKPKLERVNL